MKNAILFAAGALSLSAQRPVEFETMKALLIDNDKLELTMLVQGGSFVSLVLKDDPVRMSPMWNPVAGARAIGQPQRPGSGIGHFVCVDGFGPTSAEERQAGLQGHGEAHRLPFEMLSSGKQDGRFTASFQVTLPIVQEVFRRKVTLADGEQVVRVDSEIESLLGFDRAMNWAEHATIGTPFLTSEKTVVDTSAGKCQVRPNNRQQGKRLDSGKDFEFPAAPAAGGGTADVRIMPANQNSMDHTACVMDPAREHAWVTALRTDTRLLLGYLWPRADYPWLQQWMNFAANGNTAWGLEFGTQPYDVSRRTTMETGAMFGVPAFKILPAKAKIATRFLMFYGRVPEGFTKVHEVRQENGKVVIEDRTAGKRLELAVSSPL